MLLCQAFPSPASQERANLLDWLPVDEGDDYLSDLNTTFPRANRLYSSITHVGSSIIFVENSLLRLEGMRR